MKPLPPTTTSSSSEYVSLPFEEVSIPKAKEQWWSVSTTSTTISTSWCLGTGTDIGGGSGIITIVLNKLLVVGEKGVGGGKVMVGVD